ncbi:SusC/RagA family TonB-linked outer membrane protein [Rhizosphaericola mali]|uniref:TonB-dependent receptor plug domain-containing protein n=1 Tax=Rhizosphaericola mali TaxID=2545455 RepID=A0A5P2G0R6_9BACT|nr:SusC/RagA family TonB-linked outer membrane protein [Rhizosphaericola mali]QES89025.1 TonB-dependent receptor plug domain-containing protein [Rhizosphaericola mali]
MKFRIDYKIILCCCVIFVLLIKNLNAQNVTLKVKNRPLIEVLNTIKKQTGYNFFYNSNVLKYSNNVTLNIESKALDVVLKQIFTDQPIDYKIANNTIALRLLDNNISPNYEYKSLIKGRVVDIFTTPIESVTIVNKSTSEEKNSIALTDKSGNFIIEGKVGDTLLLYSPYIITNQTIFKGQKSFEIVADLSQGMLERVTIQTITEKKKDPTRYVDLTNRLYMNLGQVLQGTIPGLSMQLINTSGKRIKSISQYLREKGGFITMTEDEFLHSGDPHAQEIVNGFLSGNISPYAYGTDGSTQLITAVLETVMSSAMVPQIRGVNTFGNGLNGMLVVIDGFPQDGFPADYPMSNVESIEVIKDPKELLKWGDKANGGVILIRTKGAKQNRPTINFNASFYITPAPKFDRNKLKLANSSEYLDYYKSLYDSGYIAKVPELNTSNLDPASRILNDYNYGVISESQYNKSWDSLGSLNNQDQMKLLQQNSFNNIYNLSVMGSTKHYKYNFIGMYNGTKSNAIGNKNNSYGLSSTNEFMLLKDKLHISWYSNVTYNKAIAGTQLDPINGLLPFQMILDDQGNYVYDYSNTISPVNNELLKSYGYKEFGSNILQDARKTKTSSRGLTLRSRLNWEWKLLKELNWVSSVYYNSTDNKNEVNYGENTSYTRQLLNNYGNYSNNTVNFYVPNGDIHMLSKQKVQEINVRSALSFNKAFGKHYFNATIGSGGSIYNSLTPASNTLYGYSNSRKSGLPISLPAGNPQSGISNYSHFLGNYSSVYPYTLLNRSGGDSTKTRSLNWNSSFNYSFSDYLTISYGYNASYSPNYGMTPPYSKVESENGDVTIRPFIGMKNSVFKNVGFSTGIMNTKMPNLPNQLTTFRYLQSSWNNYAIIINDLNPTQQVGQTSKNFYQRINIGFFDKKINLFVGNNIQKMGNIGRLVNSKTVYDSSFSSKYINAGISGNIFDSTLSFNVEYSKSPEGLSQVNGTMAFNLYKALRIHARKISSLQFDMQIENVSPMQGLGIQMGTNVSTGNGFSIATNGVLNSLPAKNTNYEVRGKIGFNDENTILDVRYYNRTTSGLSSQVPIYTDPATGLNSQMTYSSIQNKGIEFFLKLNVLKTRKFSYNITLNGAYNSNIAKNVPTTNFSVSSNYSTAYRNDYSINNVWSYKWAGLNNQGLPQIYDSKGQVVVNPDSATLASSIVYSGVSKAPWTGGFIHEFTFGDFFARSTLVFNYGAVMRRHIPTPSGSIDNTVYVKDRWRKPGDEKFTDIPGLKTNPNINVVNFISQYSSNSIMSADFVRLQEVMIGCYMSKKILSFLHIKSGFFTLQAQNLAFWAKNKYHLDPSTVAFDGRLGLPIPKMYACSINVNL